MLSIKKHADDPFAHMQRAKEQSILHGSDWQTYDIAMC